MHTTAELSKLAESTRPDQFIPVRKEDRFQDFCGSGCTTVMTYIPKERLCFGPQGKLGFHQARYNTAKGPIAPEVTQRMFDNYPAEIQRWISAHGGPKELPSEGYLYLSASELWEMGYRKCSY
jgi:hypothetical protein